MSIREKVAQAIRESHKLASRDSQHPPYINDAAAAIEAFLEAAAKQGWHLRPDEATEEMMEAGAKAENENRPVTMVTYARVLRGRRAMLAVAPEFKWKDDS